MPQTSKNLSALFSPKSVAVVGASRSPNKVGAIVLKNIVESGFTGNIYPVNPNAEIINGMKCYKNVSNLPEVPDLAIITIPAQVLLDVLVEMGEKKIKNVVVLSAGFKEIGPEGLELENKLKDISEKYGINLLGPNCLGFVNNQLPVNATFGKVIPQVGSMRFILQSGAIATSLFDWCGSMNLGFSEFITLGNKAVLNESDALEYFFDKSENNITSLVGKSSDQIHPIGLYLESISDGPRFIQITKQIAQHDPIFILKPGKTTAASGAMQSHTGAIAGDNDVLNAVFKQTGIIRCDTLEDFFDLSKAFSWGTIPKGPRVAVISNAGGPAVISADRIVEEGLEMAEFDEDTKKKLSEVLPKSASVINPIDVLGDALADRFANAVDIALQSGKCDSLIVILTPQVMTQIEETAEKIGEVSKKYNKPVFCSFIGGSLVGEGRKVLNKLKIPNFRFPERAIYSVGSMWKFKQQQEKNEKSSTDMYQILNFDLMPESVSEIIKNAVKNNQFTLDNLQADKVVSGFGINTPKTLGTKKFDEALKFTESVGYPVVLKMSSPNLLHKKKVGGIVLGISDKNQLKDAWNNLEKKKENLDKSVKDAVFFQVQKEVSDGVEVIVGVKNDKTFGSVLLFGAGGSLAELISDKNISLLPIDTNRARELVEGSKIFKSLRELEDKEAESSVLNKLYELIVKISKIVDVQPEIEEIEINPIIVNADGVWAVDTKVILKESRKVLKAQVFKTATAKSAQILTGKMHYFEFESDEPFEALPGQYVSVKVSDTRINCYSIAGLKEPKKFNLLIDTTPGGPGSIFFENVKVGDKINFLGPFGTFILKPDDDVKSILFLATGCGAAPMKYMIESILEKKESEKEISFYLGLNNFEDIFMKDYFEELSRKHKNFRFQIAINNPNPLWKGPVGFITDLVKKDYPDASKCSAYLCGNKFMIDDVTKILIENGCPSKKIYMEKYGKF